MITAMMGRSLKLAGLLLLCAPFPTIAADLVVLSVEPAARSMTAEVDAPIVIHFDKAVDPASVVLLDSIWAFGRWSGTVQGTLGFSDGNQTVTLTPSKPLSAGEVVMVILSHDITAMDATTLRPGGYSFQFWTKVGRSPMDFALVETLNVRGIDGNHTQAYGGFATDLNGDGFLDLSIVNEITADLRVFMNQADNSGLFNDFLDPPFAIGNRASPSEPTDFDRDGHADVCVANIDDGTISVLLGNGDGTFAAQQLITVGSQPRGIAVLDVDGDGDMDIVNTNAGSSSLTLMYNDGTGSFGPSSSFDAGNAGEWALAAGDMNQDGLLDLVVGGGSSPYAVVVNTANGDGTFSLASSTPNGGRVWMLVCGDVDGNGTEDVAAVNQTLDQGQILRGDGMGNLAAPQNYFVENFPIATDLGDLDGDGDLDWVTSSFNTGQIFNPGEWSIMRNNGGGVFFVAENIDAPRAGSCALLFDSDNDGDLDLAVIDEITDQVLLLKNSGTVFVPTVSQWGLIVLGIALLVFGSIITKRRRARSSL